MSADSRTNNHLTAINELVEIEHVIKDLTDQFTSTPFLASAGRKLPGRAAQQRRQDLTGANDKSVFEDETDSFDIEHIEIGSFVDGETLLCAYTLKDRQITLDFDDSRTLLTWLCKGVRYEYKYEMRFYNIDDAITKDYGPDNNWIIMEFALPPKMFLSEVNLSGKQVWRRVTEHERYPQVDYGNHRVYRFKLTKQEVSSDGFSHKIGHLKRLNLKRNRNPNIFKAQPSLLSSEFKTVQRIAKPYIKLSMNHHYEIPFDIYYSLEILLSHGYISKYAITDKLMRLLLHGNINHALVALETLFQKRKRIQTPTKDIGELLPEDPESVVGYARPIPEGCALIRKVIVTPTRILFVPPTVELGNRVLRKFAEYSDRFLRVCFADEDQRCRVDGISSENVLDRFRQILRNGFRLCGRHYQFLAFSASQLRDHSCWFFSETDGQNGRPRVTAPMIRDWMGDFSNITNIAKYASRMGQCFSSTLPVGLEEESMCEIPDVERNGFCFSDGIGRISEDRAERIAKMLDLPETPRAFQIRAAGYKGVLSVDARIGPKDPQVQFRPSMNKFAAGHPSSLEIVRYSQYSPGSTNHQLITLFSCLGVPDEALLDLQRQMQLQLDSMLEDQATALNLLLQFAGTSPLLKVAVNMINAGISIVREPFLLNMINLFQCSKLREMKFKARIHIPESTQLIGVLDELGMLDHGQIFVQISDPQDLEGRRKKVITGIVTLAKMPAVHPGDIRVLQAVDIPELRAAYFDVVVFPQKGSRPHTIEASGSDLDGDIYFVSWDKSLLSPLRNLEPFDYANQNPKPSIREKEVSVDEVIDFMVNYMRNDNLGLIATAHKIHADLASNGALSEICLYLAKLHSIAVDFPKSGIFADFDWQDYNIKEYPDFLGKPAAFSYPSRKALGKLFREARPLKFQPSLRVDVDNVFLVKGFEDYVKPAERIKRQYDLEIQRLMKHYDICSEMELVSQLIIDFKHKKSRREFELKIALNDVMNQLRKHYRRVFMSDPAMVDDRSGRVTYRKASAWYFAAYAPRGNLFSFPWIVIPDLLIDIFQRKGIRESDCVHSAADMNNISGNYPKL